MLTQQKLEELVTMQKELIGKPTPKRKENHAHLET
jgi:hypothetical protein